MVATLLRQMVGSRAGLLVAATVSPYLMPPAENKKPTKVISKNQTRKKLKIKIDADRQMDSIVTHGWSVDANLGLFGISGGGKAKSNNTDEYEVYHIVDTNDSFSTVDRWGKLTFYPPDNDNLHAFMTIQAQNPDGSWLMVAENHPILKRCTVAYSEGTEDYERPGTHVTHRGIDQIIPNFRGKEAKLIEEYKLGFVEVGNLSNYEVLVRVDTDGINPKKIKTEVGGSLHGGAKIGKAEANFKLGGEKVNEVTKNVYYRANQSVGYTYLGVHHQAEYYLRITNDTYYVSVDYIKNGKVIQHQRSVPYKYYSAKGIPRITIYEHLGGGDIVVVPCEPGEKKDDYIGSIPNPIPKIKKSSKNKNEGWMSEEEIKKYYFLQDYPKKK